MNNKSIGSKIIYGITLFLLCMLLYFTYKYYQSNNFNDFIKSEGNLYTSEFKRDDKVKYSKNSSYRIKSDDYNDAMFYETIKVEKNQPYKVTCKVKTKDVVPEEVQSSIGAQISIEGTTERSVAIQGTSDWQQIELIFNSENRDSVNLGFRLGGNAGQAKGTAWFSDFTLEEGIAENDNNWNFACFILESTDVNLNGKNINLKVTDADIKDIETTISRFSNVCGTMSKGKMKAKCDVYKITKPLTQLSYDDEFGYYVAPENVETQIKNVIANGDYDHIFVVMKLRRRNT